MYEQDGFVKFSSIFRYNELTVEFVSSHLSHNYTERTVETHILLIPQSAVLRSQNFLRGAITNLKV